MVGRRRRRKRIRALKIRRSTSQSGVPSSEDVYIVIKSDDDFDNSYDESASSATTAGLTDTKKVKTNKFLRKRSTSIIDNTSITYSFATILNSGT